MTNYMVITCKQKNGNLLVLKTYNYHELSINFCPLVLWSKQTLVPWFFGLKKICSFVLLSKKYVLMLLCLKSSFV